MKKIIIIDGGPRKNMNTAKLLQRFAEGAKSAGSDVEVKTVRLYDLDYRGCMSCMACKLKDKASNICRFKDALTPVLEAPVLAPAFEQMLPALFGGLGVAFISKNWKIAIAPIVLMLILFICVPALNAGTVGIMVPVSVLFTIAVSRILYKRGVL